MKHNKNSINKLFDGFNYEEYWADWEKEHPNQLKEDDWGTPVGKEIW